jgi:hypothetical protein
MQLLADGLGLRHGPGDVILEVVGVGAGEADAAYAIHLTDTTQKLAEDGPAAPVQREVPAIGVDVLAEEGHLHHPVGGETLHLPDDVPGAP